MSFPDYESGHPDGSFADHQNELYDRGLHGHAPQYPITFSDLEEKAAATLPPKVRGYVVGGAGDEHTQRANREAFTRWGLYPRMLVAPEERDMSIELLGISLPSPIFMPPNEVIGVCAPRRSRRPRVRSRLRLNRRPLFRRDPLGRSDGGRRC